jgi:NAD(P)H-hydrate epimerase
MNMPYDPGPARRCEQIRALDRQAIEHYGIPGVVLMENAGRAIAAEVYRALPDPAESRVLILCGAGNNGGDGFVVARHLHNAGVPVTIVLAVPADKLRGDAETNFRIARRMNLSVHEVVQEEHPEEVQPLFAAADVIVDALLGTGASGAPRGVMGHLVELANQASQARRIAIDLPSGLEADSGTVHEPCFRAAATVTMASDKVGLAQPAARPFVGDVTVVDIGLPRELLRERADSRPTG